METISFRQKPRIFKLYGTWYVEFRGLFTTWPIRVPSFESALEIVDFYWKTRV